MKPCEDCGAELIYGCGLVLHLDPIRTGCANG